MKRFGVGVLGCGNISEIYLQNVQRFPHLRLVGVADLLPDKAKEKGEKHGVPSFSAGELINHPEVDLILNLTIPVVHGETCLSILEAGKHVHVEKPFGITKAESQAIIQKAKEKGLKTGSAPDTFLGASHQLCRKLIDEGAIGTPTSATAFMMSNGPEGWHPNPEFYFQPGGGPMFDMGPYYLTALVNLLGPVKSVVGMTSTSKLERVVGSGEKKGKHFPVEVPTHVQGLLAFEAGARAAIITSFEVPAANLPCIEIHGTDGSLSVPDPNGFGGTVKLHRGDADWEEVTSSFGYEENSRGIGAADLALAVVEGREARASGELASHVVDIMESIHAAAASGGTVVLQTSVSRPAPLKAGLAFGELA